MENDLSMKNWPTVKAGEASLHQQQPLEEVLLQLARRGRPRIHLMDRGWYCAIEMHVSSLGAEFKVASEFGHKSPNSAATECLERVERALRDLGAKE